MAKEAGSETHPLWILLVEPFSRADKLRPVVKIHHDAI